MLKYSFRRPCKYLLLQKKNNKQLFQIYFSLTRIAVSTLQKFWGALNNYQDTRYKKHHNNWQKEIRCCKYQILKKCMRWPKYASKGFHVNLSRSDNFTHDAFNRYSQSNCEIVQPALHCQQLPPLESKSWQVTSIFTFSKLTFITRTDMSARLEEELEKFLKKTTITSKIPEH